MPVVFESYEELVEFIRNWRAWGGVDEYDFTGAVHLLGACLSNIDEHALGAELEDIAEYLEAPQQQALCKLDHLLRSGAGD